MFEIAIKLVLFLLPLAFSPGPGNMFFAANGARFGWFATVPANAGYHIATWILTVTIGMGFGWFANSFPGFLIVIKYVGSAYVLYLALQLYWAGAQKNESNARHANFGDGVILFLLNPKAYLIITLIFTQFTVEGNNSQVIFIATVFTLNNLIAFSLWAFIGDKLASGFRKEFQAQHLNKVFGAMLAGVAAWMLFS